MDIKGRDFFIAKECTGLKSLKGKVIKKFAYVEMLEKGGARVGRGRVGRGRLGCPL